MTLRIPNLPSQKSLGSLLFASLAAFAILVLAKPAHAGGPRYVAGVTYFNPAVVGQPVVWANGQVAYSVDQGSLGALSHGQAAAMVDAAAAVWNSVPTAAVNLSDAGPLAEDVQGSNVAGSYALNGTSGFSSPSDVTPSATTTPVAVIFDTDGSVIDALEGVGASLPNQCQLNGVLVWIDNMNPNATLAHGVIVLNGRCTSTLNLVTMMSYELERAFGQVLGLDFSQVNDGALAANSAEPAGALAWPVMQILDAECNKNGGACIANPTTLRMDDIATLNRLYPVTAANQASFPGKVLTAANTVSIQGTLSFRNGTGMQGVNVVARPLDIHGNPMYQDTVTFVSGAYFNGNHGNPVTGFTDNQGNRFDRFGSNNSTLQGFFDLSGIPLPAGMTSAVYQVTFEAINPYYRYSTSVGPYLLGSPAPSGVLGSMQTIAMQAGSAQNLTTTIGNSATVRSELAPRPVPIRNPIEPSAPVAPRGGIAHSGAVRARQTGSVASEPNPLPLPAGGVWTGNLGQVGQSDWLLLPVQGNRIFTIVTEALDETGTPTVNKAMPAIGVWDGFSPTQIAAAGFTSSLNGNATGETWLQVASAGRDYVRVGIADQRGDGRPDYTYRGWVLYADSVYPTRLPATGGVITIRGMGFRTGDTVLVGGVAATVLSLVPTEITAQVPVASTSLLSAGSLDVTVRDQPAFNAIATIPGGISYDSGNTDSLRILTAPMGAVALNVPQPFSVMTEATDGSAAGGVTVTYSVVSGSATLGCGQSTCAVTATGDGRATMSVTATSSALSIVTASLTNGVSLQAQFYGATAPALSALTPTLFLAAGATVSWPVQALLQSGGSPSANQQIGWQSGNGINAPSSSVATNASGIASATLVVGPLVEGQSASSTACLSGSGSVCANFQVFGARPEFASLAPISGNAQTMQVGTAATPVLMRVLDMDGNPMAGGTVSVSQALYAWAPPCPTHGRCPQPQLLSTQTTTVNSALDGTVSVTPLTMAGVATNLVGVAATGNSGTLGFTVEQHP